MRRLKVPDGRRWLGRLLDPAQVTPLKIALGLTDTANAVGDGASAARLVLSEGASSAGRRRQICPLRPDGRGRQRSDEAMNIAFCFVGEV